MCAADYRPLCERTAPPSYHWLKRRIDLYLAALATAIAAPVLALLAILVRLDSPGPAFFRQTRAGLRAKPFLLLKFRTMHVHADPFGDSPRSRDDPRITRIGRWLRETSLDELPQLINVLRGEMSLVGPRPLYVQQIPEWNERQRRRLCVLPGLTGLAQINGRGGLTIEQKLEWDVRYVENCCLRLDLEILWRTFRNVWRRGGIYEVRYSQRAARRSQAQGA